MVLKFLKSSFEKVKNVLTKTRDVLGDKLRSLFGKKIDDETLEQLEQLFYEADVGIQIASDLKEHVKKVYRNSPSLQGEELIQEIQKEIIRLLATPPSGIEPTEGPLVILVIGVNGNGKTTSVAKLAKRYQDSGMKVLIAAADTYRAAAIEQLEIWSNRLNIDIVKGAPKSDPAAVVFDAITASKSRGSDVVIIDTAGRLHTRSDLMQELEKIGKTCKKIVPDSPHETFMVLDATTGQNAIDQAKIFHKHTPITGLILTKLDGTAKGGIVINIQNQLKIPVRFIGTGESLEDIEPFDAEQFAKALLG